MSGHTAVDPQIMPIDGNTLIYRCYNRRHQRVVRQG